MIDAHRRRTDGEDQVEAGRRALAGLRIGERLVAIGVRADAVTATGVLLAAATAVVIGLHHLWVGTALLTAGGLMDTLDGAVAKAAGTTSARGAFVDSVADRVSDGLIFGGVAWYFLSSKSPKLAVLPLAILAVSALVSYERAKAESLGFVGRGGMMERAERLILLGVALAFHVLLVPLLVVLLVLTSATALGRFVRVWRQAGGAPVVETGLAARRARVESRWQSLRATGRAGTAVRRTRGRTDTEPLATRLRSVLRADRMAVSARRTATPPRRVRPGSRRATRALLRRLGDGA